MQVSERLLGSDSFTSEEGGGLGSSGGALGPADIKEELFDSVNVHYRQPAVSKWRGFYYRLSFLSF